MGGLLGFKPSTSSTIVEINKNIFYPGEHIKIRIDCDNTNSSNAVKSFKFKLHRKCMGIVNTEHGQLNLRKSEYVHVMKSESGCAAY